MFTKIFRLTYRTHTHNTIPHNTTPYKPHNTIQYRKNTKNRQVCTGSVSKQKRHTDIFIVLRHDICPKSGKITLCVIAQWGRVKTRHEVCRGSLGLC